jgi:hypothetical protein
VICAGLASYFAPPADDGMAARLNTEVGYVATGLFIAAFIAVPLGVPLGIFLASNDFSFKGLLADNGFRVGLLVQAVAALGSYVELYRALKIHTPDELNLKRRFALVFLRWMVVVMVAYFPFIYLFGQYALFVFVMIYVATTIFIELAPDRFLRAMPGGSDSRDSPPWTHKQPLQADARQQARARHRQQQAARKDKRRGGQRRH